MGKYSKKIIKALWATVFAAMFALLLCIGLVQLTSVQRWAGGVVGRCLSEGLGLPVEVGTLRFFPFSTIEISDVVISDADSLPMAGVSRAVADVSWPDLLSGRIGLEFVKVDSLDLRLRRMADGTLNIAAMAGSDSVSAGGNVSVDIKRLQIGESRLSYEPAGSKPLRIRDVNIQLDSLLTDSTNVRGIISHVSMRLPDYEDVSVGLNGTVTMRSDTISFRHGNMTIDGSLARVDELSVVVDTAGIRSARVEIPSMKLTSKVLSLAAGREVPRIGMSVSGRVDGQVIDLRRLRLSVGDASYVVISGMCHMADKQRLSWAKLSIDGRAAPTDICHLAGSNAPLPTAISDVVMKISGNAVFDVDNGDGSMGVSISSGKDNLKLYSTVHSDDKWHTMDFDTKVEVDAAPTAFTGGAIDLLTANFSVIGRTDRDKLRYATVRGGVDRLDIKGVALPEMRIHGVVDGRNVTGVLNIDEPCFGHLIAVGEYEAGGWQPIASLTMQADTVRLGRFSETVFTPDAWTSFRMKASTIGLDPQTAKAEVGFVDVALANRSDTIYSSEFVASLDIDTLGRHVVSVSSDICEGSAMCNFDLSEMFGEYRSLFAAAMPSLVPPGETSKTVKKAEFSLCVAQSRKLARMFVPDVNVSDSLTIRGSVDSETRTAWAHLSLDTLRYSSAETAGLHVAVMMNNGLLGVGLKSDHVTAPVMGTVRGFHLSAEAQDDNIVADANWLKSDGQKEGGFVNADATLWRNADNAVVARVGIDRSQLLVNGWTWVLDSCRFDISPGRVGVGNFSLASGDHSMIAQGVASASPDDTLHLELNKIVLERLLKTDATSKYSLEGDLYADAQISAVLGDIRLLSSASIERLKVNGDSLEHMDITTTWSPDDSRVDIGLDIVTGGVPRALATGYVDVAKSRMDLRFDIDSLSTGFLNFYLDACIDQWRGSTSGRLRLHGQLDNILLDARLKMNDDNYFRVMQTNVTYHIDHNDSLYISPNSLVFNNIRFSDGRKGHGVFYGNMDHDMFSGLDFNLLFDVDNALLLQTTSHDSPSYYGTVFGSGRMKISGLTDAIHIGIDARTRPGSVFTVAPSAKSDIGMQDYILFKKPDEEVVAQTVGIGLGTSADLNLNITPDAEMSVVINPQTGNKLVGRGRGQVLVSVDRVGELTMQGTYEIESGQYNFSFENIINKKFDINNGGVITWDGGPYDAIVDLTATYKLKASLYDLMQNNGEDVSSDLKRRVPVNCNIILSNKLTNPDIRFDIEIPSSQNFNQYAFDQVVNTQEEMNRQVFSLLTANRFYSPQGTGSQASTQSTSYLGTTASELISNQLSDMFSQNDRKIGIGVNYRPGDEVTNEEYELSLSTQMLNNKILLSGNIGYGRDASASSGGDGSLIGDFDVEVKLNRQGTVRAKAYTHSNNDVIYDTSPTTQGIGISFQEEFNSFRQLFRKYADKIFHRRKKEETAEVEQSTAK